MFVYVIFFRYLNESIEKHNESNSESYDAIVTSEVLEHVSDKYSFLTNCVECLKVIKIVFVYCSVKIYLSV